MLDYNVNGAKWFRAMDKTAMKIDREYTEGSRSHDIALLTLGICCDWAEDQGTLKLPKREARAALKQLVDKNLKAFSDTGEMGWMESLFMWFMMKWIIPWVIKYFLDSLYAVE